MFSPSGRCRSFSSDADGTVMSEAVAVVVLKRLDDALRDGDPIHATIIASGVNQDGASNGITAPNAEAQEQLIRETYAQFHVDPADIDYVETHGTGTKLGDVVEANALARAFASCTAGPCACALGSAKSHIGHASAASGVVGLIKIVLSMRHAAIPGQLHFTALNPLIDHANSGFRVAATTEAWVRRDGRARTAALNCFGHSGSNVHLVVRDVVQASAGVSGGPVLVPISARTEGQLREVAARLSRVLAAPGVPAAAPRDDVRSAVTRELAGILGVASRDIGIDERLEDVGVTPLHLAELALRLEQRLTLVMPVGDAEMWQSVATIAAALAPGNPAPVAAGETDLSAIAYTLQVGRKPMAERAIFQVSSIEDLREKLAAFSRGESPGRGSGAAGPMPAAACSRCSRRTTISGKPCNG